MALPPDPELPLIHTRTYDVRAYRRPDDTVLLRGIVSDLKPGHLYIDGDPTTFALHQMVVDLVIDGTFTITDAQVHFEAHPHSSCTRIADHYRNLIGLSISRGYTHKVRELFGGPRGCTHTTALLLAMGPVAMQSTWPSSAVGRPADIAQPLGNIDTCHVWRRDGPLAQRALQGQPVEVPLSLRRHFAERDADIETWIEENWPGGADGGPAS